MYDVSAIHQRLPVAACLLLLVLIEWPSSASAQSRQLGPALFGERCAVCHGVSGEGASAPDLTNPRWHDANDDARIERVIRDGVPGRGMPAFADNLDAGSRWAIIAYLRELSKRSVQPTTEVHAPKIEVDNARLLSAEGDHENWLMYGRDYGNGRYSPLSQINRDNVGALVPVWSFQTGVADGLHNTPLVIDGLIFLSTAWNHLFAIDARTGAELWHYKRALPQELKYCCGPVNWGVAVLGDTLYLGTLDAHLVAIEARTGRVRWDIEVGKPEDNLSIKSVPLVVKDKVLVGIAGGDFPSRGFIDAYDASTGKRAWRFYTVPAEGEPGAETWSGASYRSGGGGPWGIGSYDPELDLVYWGVGQPYPDYDGDARTGDNLYTDSVVALDADTGSLRWHFQYTPHDMWDWDGINELVFAEIEHDGRREKALLHADRNGHFYALNRATGKFLYAKPFVRVTWTKGFDANGRPIVNPAAIPTYEGVTVCPGAAGGKEWNAMAYDPVRRLTFVPAIENCAVFTNYGVEAKAKGLEPRPSGFRYLDGKAYGKMMAIQADTGQTAWEVKLRTPAGGGVLATAGGLALTGDGEGNLLAYDSDSGKELWSFQTGSGIRAAPVTYELDGVQYIAIASGMGGAVGGYTGTGAPWMRNSRGGSALFVFRLFESNASRPFHGGAKATNPR
ncbi:MAG: PQQ-dependent dehydrogenase, methanol/ethanol family [Bryobacterales bacterium]|nr:PQQ-dependent dehydrogenase, methanol/ethanol family [Bryobacterales bacterium]